MKTLPVCPLCQGPVGHWTSGEWIRFDPCCAACGYDPRVDEVFPTWPGATTIWAHDAQAVIERGVITIRVQVKNLPHIVEGAWAAGDLTPRYKVTDAEDFAKDLVGELNEESEDGTTRIHRMFDAAICGAIEQGAFGIEEHENQEA